MRQNNYPNEQKLKWIINPNEFMNWFLNFNDTFPNERNNMKNNIFKNYTIVGEETDSNNDYSVVETHALETQRWWNKNSSAKNPSSFHPKQ